MINATYVWLDNLLYDEELARRGKSGLHRDLLRGLREAGGAGASRQLMAAAAEDVGSYWYTAWTVAGRPELK